MNVPESPPSSSTSKVGTVSMSGITAADNVIFSVFFVQVNVMLK